MTAWAFEFVSGPFDGFEFKPVPEGFCSPAQTPPASLIVWEEEGRMHVSAEARDGERYLLDDMDREDAEAFYVWGTLEEGERHRLRESVLVPA